MTWHAQANCLGVSAETFFPERGDNNGVRIALAICTGCTVREQCIDENLDEKDGIYGGTTGAQRRKLRSTRTVNRKCLHCGSGFKAWAQQQFCTDECRTDRRQQKKTESAARAWWSEA